MICFLIPLNSLNQLASGTRDKEEKVGRLGDGEDADPKTRTYQGPPESWKNTFQQPSAIKQQLILVKYRLENNLARCLFGEADRVPF